MENLTDTNRAELSGTVLEEAKFSHSAYGESFYVLTLGIRRRSGYADAIKILLSDRLLWNGFPPEGSRVEIRGQVRTYNEYAEGKNHLNVVIFAKECVEINEEEQEDENLILLEGYLCKPAVARVSPLGREICDLMVAVNRMYNKSDYVPCIAWGRNARYAAGFAVGDKIRIVGRIQSREYRKKDEGGSFICKVAYEVSVLKLNG